MLVALTSPLQQEANREELAFKGRRTTDEAKRLRGVCEERRRRTYDPLSLAEELSDDMLDYKGILNLCQEYYNKRNNDGRELIMSSTKLSTFPRTLGAKLYLLHKTQIAAEESFDNDEKTYAYDLTEAEFRFFELIQTLGSDFTEDIINIIEGLQPDAMCVRTGEGKKFADNNR